MRCCLLLLFLPHSHSSTLMEGDVITDPGFTSQGSLGQSAALANPQRLWPGGRVYYIFDEAFSEKNRKVVTSAMDYMTVTNPCLSFEDIGLTGNSRTDYVRIFNAPKTCSSQLGRVGGEQELRLNTGCLHGIRIAVHELCHTIGFLHEHTRPDRNSWVKIVEANIMDGKEDNFRKREEASSAGFNSQYDKEMSLDPKDTPYDMDSILHYGPLDFSKNGQPVIKFLHDDEGRWPVAPPEDPLTIIDRVEIALTYADEANCMVKNTDMVKYVHINRMVNRLWIDNNKKMIEAQQLEIKENQQNINGLQRTIEAQQLEIEAKQGNIDGLQLQLQGVIEAQQNEIKGNSDLLKQLVESLPPAPCRNPKILYSKVRHVSTPGGFSPTCGSTKLCCDSENDYTCSNSEDYRGEGWYRFTGDAGTKMPDSPAGYRMCGCQNPGYLSGGHPTVHEKEVERNVDFILVPDMYRQPIKVINCGTFYVYRLVNLGRYRAYCGE